MLVVLGGLRAGGAGMTCRTVGGAAGAWPQRHHSGSYHSQQATRRFGLHHDHTGAAARSDESLQAVLVGALVALSLKGICPILSGRVNRRSLRQGQRGRS